MNRPDDTKIQTGYENEPYQDGFNIKTIIAALFIGLIMLPGGIYLGLITGQSVGGAAQWVTIILFVEIAKRSFGTVKRQEVYIIYSIAAGLVAPGVVLGAASLVLHGGFFSQNIWNQFFRQSSEAVDFGIAHLIPTWVVPPPEVLIHRTFFHRDWIVPIMVLMAHQALFQVNSLSLSYVLFRFTSDVERLEFPMAYVAAGGATALAETTAKKETWRWRIFSIGTMFGLVFGAIYVGIPTLTGLVMAKPLTIIPIPFIDFTTRIGKFLPASAMALGTDIGLLLMGMVIPFWSAVGWFIGETAAGTLLNPLFHKLGLLTHWKPGMGVLATQASNNLDFWISVMLGMGLIVGIIGIWKTVSSMKQKGITFKKMMGTFATPEGRGDIPVIKAILIWGASTVIYIWFCHTLVPDFPVWIFVVFGLLVTPFISYIAARLIGIAGGSPALVSFPYLKEASFILSGKGGAAIWFAPVPFFNHGGRVQEWKITDLTRTKFVSVIKATALAFVVTAFCSFLFWSIIWKLNPIPSAMYPFVQKMWGFYAWMKALWVSGTVEGGADFMRRALKPNVIAGGAMAGGVIYAATAFLGAPVPLFYGLLMGVGALPSAGLPVFTGAILSRYIIGPKVGRMWKSYAPVLLAGYGCGMGLVAMASVALALIAKSVSQLIF